MTLRARVAVVAALAAGSPLPAPATAAECVRVVVDYGTFADAPAGPNTRCVDVGSDGTAADALRGRARYKGNFLCAIDGYPKEPQCGDHGTEPYWSFWIFRNGGWVYASEGVGTFTVSDADRDGHPDPLGFRYHAFESKQAPRATPAYPKPAPTTTAPAPRPAPRRTVTSSAPGATTGTAPRTPGASPTNGPAAGPSGGEPTAGAPGHPLPGTPGATASGPPAATVTGDPGAPPSGAAGGTANAPEPGADGPAPGADGGLPVGTAVGGLLAAALLGAAAYRFRKPAA